MDSLCELVYRFIEKCDSGQIINNLIAEVIAGVFLALIILILSDYIFKYPNLCGKWEFKLKVIKTDYIPYNDLELKYVVLLRSSGNAIFGTGEKVWEKAFGNDKKGIEKTYEGKNRRSIRITGSIERNFLNRNKVIIHYEEDGLERMSSSIQMLKVYSFSTKMIGMYYSTIAGKIAEVSWEKIER